MVYERLKMFRDGSGTGALARVCNRPTPPALLILMNGTDASFPSDCEAASLIFVAPGPVRSAETAGRGYPRQNSRHAGIQR